DLLDDVPERRADVRRRGLRLGLDLDALDSLAVVSVAGGEQAVVVRTLAREIDDTAVVGEYRGVVVVAQASGGTVVTPDRLRTVVAAAVAHPVTVIVPRAPSSSLPGSFQMAARTARLLDALDVSGLTALVDDFLPYSAVLDTDAEGLAAFLQDTLGAVRAYDAERNADLVRTLRAFVRNGASPTRTARALRFHTNTILQRLERLDRILGDGWRDDERMFRIGLAVRLDELRERLGRR
ncbi:MAG: helix-turn-helix domain-containing protein, partial [Microbacterium chocolatum]|nr:helix-turn-helix domain-containing protein [Microbacterium chocolatum]